MVGRYSSMLLGKKISKAKKLKKSRENSQGHIDPEQLC